MESKNNQDAQLIKMTTMPVPKLIISLAIPSIISMLISSLYSMVDTFFVSRLGTSATGAVGIVFSLMAIIQAIGFTLGIGSGSNMSRLLGQKQNHAADVIASTGFFSALAAGSLLAVCGVLFTEPFMKLLGATDTILPYAVDYARYILIGAPIMCAAFVLNSNLRFQGKSLLGMIGIVSGAILNIILCPIFVFVLNMGITGAAIATLISQCISFLILLSFFLRGKSIIKITIRAVSKDFKIYVLILKTGFPSFCRQGLASIAAIALNVNSAVYGDAAVAAMSVVSRIFLLILSVMIGFGQGYQPVASFNYGAGRYDRVKKGFWFEIQVGTVIMVILGSLGFIFAKQVMGYFSKDDMDVITIGTLAFRLQCVFLPLAPLTVISNMMFQAVGKAGRATFAAASKQGIFFMPLIFILPRILGILGIQLTQPFADVLSFLVCTPLVFQFFKELDSMMEHPGQFP